MAAGSSDGDGQEPCCGYFRLFSRRRQVREGTLNEPLFYTAAEDGPERDTDAEAQRWSEGAAAADALDASGFDANGFDANGFDAEGYDANGFDADGLDVDGLDTEARRRLNQVHSPLSSVHTSCLSLSLSLPPCLRRLSLSLIPHLRLAALPHAGAR